MANCREIRLVYSGSIMAQAIGDIFLAGDLLGHWRDAAWPVHRVGTQAGGGEAAYAG